MPTTTTVDGKAIPTPEIAAHLDLLPNDVAEVIFSTGPAASDPLALLEVEVVVHSATAPVWFTVDGSTPVARGRRCYVVPAAPAADARVPSTFRPTVVKLLSTAAAVVSVQRVR